jgi:hypothetical protein
MVLALILSIFCNIILLLLIFLIIYIILRKTDFFQNFNLSPFEKKRKVDEVDSDIESIMEESEAEYLARIKLENEKKGKKKENTPNPIESYDDFDGGLDG